MRLTRTSSGELRLREPTASRSGAARACACQPHSGAFPHVPAVEDRHVAAQEDIAEDPEGPIRRGHVQSLEAKQAEAGATPSNLQGDKPGHWTSRPPSLLLPRKPKLRPAHCPRPRKGPSGPCSALVSVRSHSQLHLPSPLPPHLPRHPAVFLTSAYLDDVVLGGEVKPDTHKVEGHGRER